MSAVQHLNSVAAVFSFPSTQRFPHRSSHFQPLVHYTEATVPILLHLKWAPISAQRGRMTRHFPSAMICRALAAVLLLLLLLQAVLLVHARPEATLSLSASAASVGEGQSLVLSASVRCFSAFLVALCSDRELSCFALVWRLG